MYPRGCKSSCKPQQQLRSCRAFTSLSRNLTIRAMDTWLHMVSTVTGANLERVFFTQGKKKKTKKNISCYRTKWILLCSLSLRLVLFEIWICWLGSLQNRVHSVCVSFLFYVFSILIVRSLKNINIPINRYTKTLKYTMSLILDLKHIISKWFPILIYFIKMIFFYVIYFYSVHRFYYYDTTIEVLNLYSCGDLLYIYM